MTESVSANFFDQPRGSLLGCLLVKLHASKIRDKKPVSAPGCTIARA
jgi:hypothetical protein